MRNKLLQGNSITLDGLKELARRLPSGWRASATPNARAGADLVVRIASSSRRSGRLAFRGRARLDPKDVAALTTDTRAPSPPLVVVAPYLSAATRQRLRDHDLGYLDLTGNARIVMPDPGLFIETQGAAENPHREERPARTLRGAKAGRIVRALIDNRQPPGVRDLAVRTRVDAGYVSRVLALLDSEALVTRVGRGRLASVDWPALLRRWAQDAPLEARGRAQTFLEPRGLSAFLARLAKTEERYALTGSLAAAAIAPIAAPRLATLWMRDADNAAVRLGLRPTQAGANVLLLEPHDDGVFDGATQRDDLQYAAPSQVAADLLTSPGRAPAEADELLDWMRVNEEAWRR